MFRQQRTNVLFEVVQALFLRLLVSARGGNQGQYECQPNVQQLKPVQKHDNDRTGTLCNTPNPNEVNNGRLVGKGFVALASRRSRQSDAALPGEEEIAMKASQARLLAGLSV